jgi:hypothetical protein
LRLIEREEDATMLYKNNVSKGTLRVVQAFAELVNRVSNADTSKIKDTTKRMQAEVYKQLLAQVLTSGLEGTLAKTLAGAKLLAEQKGDDPSKVADPGRKFLIVDPATNRKGLSDLPPELVRSLCYLQTAGFDRPPNLGAKDQAKLDVLVTKNPLDATKKDDESSKIDDINGLAFLGIMKTSMVGVNEKATFVAADIAKQDKLLSDNLDLMKSVYGEIPDFAGHEYTRLPPPEKGDGEED